jgi:hypothetical protein
VIDTQYITIEEKILQERKRKGSKFTYTDIFLLNLGSSVLLSCATFGGAQEKAGYHTDNAPQHNPPPVIIP